MASADVFSICFLNVNIDFKVFSLIFSTVHSLRAPSVVCIMALMWSNSLVEVTASSGVGVCLQFSVVPSGCPEG